MFIVKGIVAGHFDNCHGRYPKGATAKASYDEILKVLELMHLSDEYPVLMGAGIPMENETTQVASEGASFIIEEAMKDDPRPLFIGMQSAVTDLASAILLKPEICDRMTAILIGGGPYPDGEQEFNFWQDVNAVNVIFSSRMPVWQFSEAGFIALLRRFFLIAQKEGQNKDKILKIMIYHKKTA